MRWTWRNMARRALAPPGQPDRPARPGDVGVVQVVPQRPRDARRQLPVGRHWLAEGGMIAGQGSNARGVFGVRRMSPLWDSLWRGCEPRKKSSKAAILAALQSTREL